MAEIRLNYEEANRAVTQFNTGKAKIQDSIAQTAKDLNQLRSTWQGKAATDFETLYSDYDKGAKQMNEMLEALSKSLDGFAKSVQEFESKAFR